MISVVVNSLNEGSKLRGCLESVKDWADELVVIDMESTDSTVEVAKQFGAKVYSHKPVAYVEPVRRFAVNMTKGDWILILDPDEIVPNSLQMELSKIAKEERFVAVNVPRLNIIFGKKIKHTNFWPDRHIRFIKKGKVTFLDVIHSYPKVNGEIRVLPSEEKYALNHFPYQNFGEYWQRMKRYSNVEAQNKLDSREPMIVAKTVGLGFYDFIRRYIRHLGFFDND